jgi:hypothetical protein
MKMVFSGQHGRFAGLFVGLIAFLVVFSGCTKDEGSPSAPPSVGSSQSLATDWTGAGTVDLGSAGGGSITFDQDVSLTVMSGKSFAGIVRYIGRSSDPRVVDVSFFGNITTSGGIAIAESLYCCADWGASPSSWAVATGLVTRLSATRDTIYGSGVAHMGRDANTSGSFSWPYTFVWVKK